MLERDLAVPTELCEHKLHERVHQVRCLKILMFGMYKGSKDPCSSARAPFDFSAGRMAAHGEVPVL